MLTGSDILRWFQLRRLRNLRARQGRGYHEIVRRRRSKRLRRGRIRRTCVRLTYQIPISILAALGIVVILMHSGDRRVLTPEEIATAGYGYNLTSFEVRHLPAKWIHRIYSSLPWTEIDDEERLANLERYERMAGELRAARDAYHSALARGDAATASIEQARIDSALRERNEIRDSVEELLESALSTELIALGLNRDGEFIWPPVDFRIDDTPHVLVTSPRDEIRRESVRILRPELAETEKLAIEGEILDRADQSAVILSIGGLASYPNLVPSVYGLLPLLEVSAHEWIHAYLLFQPLGRAYWSNADMTSLNETLANLAGKEIGRTVYNRLTGNDIETLEAPFMHVADDEHEDAEPDNHRFDARAFLYETRIRTDELLAQGEIERAEEYMEERRLVLVENGHNIRKLNQAYFAFHGLYADGPASTSPLASQIWELRHQVPNAGALIKLLQPIPNYDQFHHLLDQRGIER